MRVLRAKLVRRHLKFYKLVFGVDAPYHIILDGNFIFNAIKFKLDIRDRLEKLLQGGAVKFYVLTSVLKELELVGTKAKSAKDFATVYCELIDDDSVKGDAPSERMSNFIWQTYGDSKTSTKTKRYFVATQDQELRRTLAQTPGVPLIYLNNVTLVLEAPSQRSLEYNQNLEQSKTTLNEEETAMLSSIGKKRKSTDAETTAEAEKEAKKSSSGTSSLTTALAPGVAVVSRKKHKAHAPNPLSAAKASEDSANSKKKKERKFRKFY